MNAISTDSETTGVDLNHSCRPFFWTVCDGDDSVFWKWKVDPLTRMPRVVKGDVDELRDRINEADEIVLQNAKFDILAAETVGIIWTPEWYKKTHDTLFSGHLLATGEPHDLTTMSLRYLRVDIQPYEDAVKEVCKEARQIARLEFPDWLIAKEGLPGLPSAKGEMWKWDMWLPEAIADEKGYPEDHPYRTALPAYGCVDSSVTLPLHRVHERLLKERGLTDVYEERRKLIRVIRSMEARGVTYSNTRMTELKKDFEQQAEEANQACLNLSGGKLDKLPKSGTTKAMIDLLFNDFQLPVVTRSDKTGVPSVDANVLRFWESTLPNKKPLAFVKNLKNKRSKDTAVSYINGYERYALPWKIANKITEFKVLYPSLNATGSATLRMSSSSPNEQNISKKEDANLRYGFGPAPGREWWSLDYENLELRLPAYEAEETEMIRLFELPDEAPFYGSYHLLVAETLYPKEFAQCLRDGVAFKDRYKATLYQWVKNGNFAVQYGAMEESGTADAAYHMVGAQRRIQSRFSNVAELNQRMIAIANKQGYVDTLFDHDIGAAYPIQTPRHFRGKVKPTIPLNYHIQGSAMWGMCKAMVRCFEYLETLPNHYINMQVHDEMVFDFPKGKTPTANLPKILKLKALMELSGEDFRIPLKVDYSYHPENWAKSVDVETVAL